MSDNIIDISSDSEVSVNDTNHPFGEDTDSEEDEDYNPTFGGWISEELYDSETFDVSNEVQFNEEEAKDLNSFVADIGGEDEVLQETKSDGDVLSDVAFFDFDNDFMPDGVADEESDGHERPEKQMRGVPFRVSANDQIKLEVDQLSQNLHHFRQVIRDFAVQDGFQLRRIKSERDRYTAECAYERCGWRIHAFYKFQSTEGRIFERLKAITRARCMSFERKFLRSIDVCYRARCQQWCVFSGMLYC
ncbi:hypothetical protein ACOSP7_010209 [Xanthoceras sorbifolium]